MLPRARTQDGNVQRRTRRVKIADDAAAATRDRALLDEFAREYERPLTRFFMRRVASAADVPDLLQEVFLRLSAMADPGRIEHRDRFIFVTAANVLRDRVRRETVARVIVTIRSTIIRCQVRILRPTAFWKVSRPQQRCAPRCWNCRKGRGMYSCYACWRG